MRLGNIQVDFFVDTLVTNPDALLGLSILNGMCEGCGEEAIAVQLGLFFITFTITFAKCR
jgi:hypothetical protein